MNLANAVASLGDGPLNEQAIARHIAPLFSRVLASDRIYLANHSLGRPLDAMAKDVAEGASLWYTKLGDAWDGWMEEREAFRARIARLIGAPQPDCIVPRTSAGQGLRAVLNAMPGRPRVISTRGEFDAVDVILKQYAALGKIEIRWVEPDTNGDFSADALAREVDRGADLVVVSQVMFKTAQIVSGLDQLAEACHARGARLLVDLYHAVGVIPIDVQRIGADFAIGGSYKYLRGGPGAGYLYLSPRASESDLRPLDTGWFANADTFSFERPDPPVLKSGGDAFLEGTPAVLTWYQARSGQEFTLAMVVSRLREYSLRQLAKLRGYLAEGGLENVTGGDDRHGAFLSIRLKNAMEIPALLEQEGVSCDARGEVLRLCPDCLTRDEELQRAVTTLHKVLSAIPV
ncbi:MAG TPA: aminotransferase class V-fold PLP-dependent enzyme [Silvibacterium sp.]|nr:aminotransferase class V-fold PLP-dependent enzyme [Silvibacterium sp.]